MMPILAVLCTSEYYITKQHTSSKQFPTAVSTIQLLVIAYASLFAIIAVCYTSYMLSEVLYDMQMTLNCYVFSLKKRH